jgi:hypothetical protein
VRPDCPVGTIPGSAASEQSNDQQTEHDSWESVIEMSPANTAEALFVSSVQPSDRLSFDEVRDAIRASLRQHGGLHGCATICAGEYGDHPAEAAARMRWALAVVSQFQTPAVLAA